MRRNIIYRRAFYKIAYDSTIDVSKDEVRSLPNSLCWNLYLALGFLQMKAKALSLSIIHLRPEPDGDLVDLKKGYRHMLQFRLLVIQPSTN